MSVWLYILLLAAAGLVVFVLGFIGLRSRNVRVFESGALGPPCLSNNVKQKD